jgi:hypothetical protein
MVSLSSIAINWTHPHSNSSCQTTQNIHIIIIISKITNSSIITIGYHQPHQPIIPIAITKTPPAPLLQLAKARISQASPRLLASAAAQAARGNTSPALAGGLRFSVSCLVTSQWAKKTISQNGRTFPVFKA